MKANSVYLLLTNCDTGEQYLCKNKTDVGRVCGKIPQNFNREGYKTLSYRGSEQNSPLWIIKYMEVFNSKKT